jgi:hypothetical protein
MSLLGHDQILLREDGPVKLNLSFYFFKNNWSNAHRLPTNKEGEHKKEKR